jgi:hypothetical protein
MLLVVYGWLGEMVHSRCWEVQHGFEEVRLHPQRSGVTGHGDLCITGPVRQTYSCCAIQRANQSVIALLILFM